jgi:hypothetical protein
VKNLGLAESDIWGFRTPFLCQTSTSMGVEETMKFVYDCSITHEPKDYDRMFVWPYTLDNGTAPNSQTGLGNHPGIWELPVYNVTQDTSGYPTMCGMDYSIWPWITTKSQIVNWLSWTLNMRLKTGKNRAPMTVGMHPDLYSPSNDEQIVLGWPVQLKDRKAAFVEFVTYALSKPMVRFVSGKQLITWMRNPVGLDGQSGIQVNTGKRLVKTNAIAVSSKKVLFTIANAGNYSLTLFSASGKQYTIVSGKVFFKGSYSVSLDKAAAAGVYIVQLSGGNTMVEKKINIY